MLIWITLKSSIIRQEYSYRFSCAYVVHIFKLLNILRVFFQEKTKQTRLSIEDRVKILKRLENGEKSVKLAHEYKVTASGIANIKKCKENLLKHRSSLIMCQGKTSKKRCTGVENSRLDQSLYEWFLQERNNGNHVTGPMIQKKALEINKNLNGPESFKASTGFLHKFKERHNINLSFRTKETDEEKYLDQNSSNNFGQKLTNDHMEQGWQILKDREVGPKDQTNDGFDENKRIENNEHLDDSNCMDDLTAENAFDAINTFMSWYQTHSQCSPEDWQYLWKFWKHSLNQALLTKKI